MYISDAADLIRGNKILGSHPQTWCDLGCGTGTFTLALATLLPAGSVIHAIDKDEKSLAQIPNQYEEVTIHKEVVDLAKNELRLPAVHGVLMANLLHYMKNQRAFMEKLKALSKRLLIVEYDGRGPNQWVPYPVGFSTLQGLLLDQGFTEIIKLGTRASRFGGELYSALAE